MKTFAIALFYMNVLGIIHAAGTASIAGSGADAATIPVFAAFAAFWTFFLKTRVWPERPYGAVLKKLFTFDFT